MVWLLPALVATSAISILVSVVYFYLFKQEGQRYLAIWAGCWFMYSLRFIIHALVVQDVLPPGMIIVQQATSLISGYLFIFGTYLLLEKDFSKIWIFSASICFLWTVIATWLSFSFLLIHIPTAIFLALIFAVSGYAILKSENIKGTGKHITGWGLIIWGIHKADYPFLRPILWFAPWGYLLASILFLSTAIGILLIYFEKIRFALGKSERLLLQHSDHLEDLVNERTLEIKKAHQEQTNLRRRLEGLWRIARLVDADYKEISDVVLEEITTITKSKYGLHGILNKDESEMTAYSWSKEVMTDCKVHSKPLEFIIEESGVWGNAIRFRKPFIMNDYRDDDPNKKGLPEGHISIANLLAVPVFRRDRIIALGAVANKGSDYTEEDIEQLSTLLTNAQILLEKRESDDDRERLIIELENAFNEIKALRGILPICSICKNIRNDEGNYVQIEEYIHKHSGVDFSHTICPPCMKKHYPEEYDSIKQKKRRLNLT